MNETNLGVPRTNRLEAPIRYLSLAGRGLGSVVPAIRRLWCSRYFVGSSDEQPTHPQARWHLLVLLSVAAVLLFWRVDRPLIDPTEGRQAMIPYEMLESGDLLTPRLGGRPYFEKPALHYLLVATTYRIVGTDQTTAHLVPVLMGLLTVWLTYRWGKCAVGERAAFLAALGLSLSVGFVLFSRTILPDGMLVTLVTGSYYAAYRAMAPGGFRWRWWLLSSFGCGLGVLTKGPLALALVAPPVFLVGLVDRRLARPRLGAWIAYGVVLLAMAAPWYVFMAVNYPGFVAHFLWKSNVVRFAKAYNHQEPFWYFLPVLWALMFPWGLLGLGLGYFLFSRRPELARKRGPSVGFCFLAASWVFLFFSVSGCKLAYYIMPMLPPLAILLGACVDATYESLETRRTNWLTRNQHRFTRWGTVGVLLFGAGSSLACLFWPHATGNGPWLATTVFAFALLAWLATCQRLSARSAWIACAAATFLAFLWPVRDLEWRTIEHFSASNAAKLVRDRHYDPHRLMCYTQPRPSAMYGLREPSQPILLPSSLSKFDQAFGPDTEWIMLVRQGASLDDFLARLPHTLEAQVELPEEGNVAVVKVHKPRT